MNVLHLTEEDCLTDEQADLLMGQLLTEESYRILVREDTDVYKPDGSLLLRFRRKVVPLGLCRLARQTFEKAAQFTENRGIAAGMDNTTGITRKKKIKKDGTISKNTISVAPVQSGIVGFFENSGGRFPYCRMTAFNLKHGEEFREALPFVQKIAKLFQQNVPDRYAAQAAVYARTNPDFRIPETVFTTITVNKNWQTAVHKDAGDLKEGFGVLTAVRSADIQGCYLCFPKYKVAVDLRTQDVVFCDVHEWHGNTPLTKKGKQSYRLSFVFYYREKVEFCGSALEELEKSKTQKGMPNWLKAKSAH